MNVLEVQQVSKSYRKAPKEGPACALCNVSFEVGAGQIFGLLGPNGAGKTTLIKCVLDLVRADRGQILLRGVPSTAARCRRWVGYLPEEYALLDYLNATQFLHYAGRLCAVPARERGRRVQRLLDQVGLATRKTTKIKAYSKGMRQRLGVAQALINDPKLLILDEPNEGLDPLGRAEMKTLLLDLKQQGVTVLISSHVLAELEHLCDRAAILNEGKLLKEGTVAALTQDKSLEASFIELIQSDRAHSVPPVVEGQTP